jgi:hypothetical protein
MKHIRNLIFMYIAGATMLVSCAKNNPNPSSTSSSQYFTVSINNYAWSALADSGQLLGPDNANVYGAKGSSVVYLTLSSLSPGTYTVSSGGPTVVNYTPDGIGLFKSDSGTVVISSYSNNIIQGTFNARLTNGTTTGYTYRLTNGKFIAKLKY